MLEHHRQQQVAPLDDLVGLLVVEEALPTSEPTRRRPDVSPEGKVRPDPEGAANREQWLARLEVRRMGALQRPHPLVFATCHVGGRAEQLEVVRFELRCAVGLRQRLVGVRPRAIGDQLAASFQHAPDVCHVGLDYVYCGCGTMRM